jgi:uncharacterized iron-regulated membrane protein
MSAQMQQQQMMQQQLQAQQAQQQQVLAAQAAAAAQNYNVTFKTVNSKQKPVQGVTVTLYSTTDQTDVVSDVNGLAKFTNITPGQHLIKAKYKDQSLEESIDVSGDNKDIELTIQIKDSSPFAMFFLVFGVLSFFIIGLVIWATRKSMGEKTDGAPVAELDDQTLVATPQGAPAPTVVINELAMHYTPLPKEFLPISMLVDEQNRSL